MEFDVQLTRDGHVVVIHDPLLDRTTDGRGSRAADDARSRCARCRPAIPARFGDRFRGERVPTLAEALGVPARPQQAMIEIKSDSVTDDEDGGIEALTIEEIRRAGMEKETRPHLVRPPRAAALPDGGARDHARAPLPRAEPGEVLAGAREVACELVMPEKGMLSDALRDRAREAGLKVATWVVDDPDGAGDPRSASSSTASGPTGPACFSTRSAIR